MRQNAVIGMLAVMENVDLSNIVYPMEVQRLLHHLPVKHTCCTVLNGGFGQSCIAILLGMREDVDILQFDVVDIFVA